MQYNITINESNNIKMNSIKSINYTIKKSDKNIQINDLLYLNLSNCNLNFNDKTVLIIGNDNTILEYLKNMVFNEIIISLNIDNINFDNISIIINTMNDIKMSRLLDSKAYQYNIPFLDFSIDNYKLSVHTVIPFITDTSSIESVYQEKSYLLCVMNNFPTEYDHTIKWAIELFDKMKCNKNIIKFAYNMFVENYNTKINMLLDTIEEETWKQKCTKPKPIKFDIDNKHHIDFIFQTVKLFDSNVSKDYILEQLVGEFKDDEIEEITLQFDKNNNDNILWIQLVANLRCDNYNIVKPTLEQIKYSCGIIPTPIESLEIAYNMMIVEMIKYFNNLDDYKNTIIDIENLTIEHFTPNPAKEIVIGNIKMNSWDKLVYRKNSTLEEFKTYYQDMFKTNISMIVQGGKMLYVEFMDIDTNKRLLELISDNTFISMMTEDEQDLPEIHIKINT